MTTLSRCHPADPASPAGPPGPLRASLDYLLGARSRVAVLRILTAQGDPVSQRELARRAGVQVRSAQQAVELLVALGVVTRLIGGRDYLVRLNPRHRLVPPLVAVFDAEARLFRDVRERIAAWGRAEAKAIAGLILFGSAARGDDVPTSDFDLLLLTARDPDRDDWPHRFAALAADVKATFGVDAHLLVMGLNEARRRWRRREAPVPEIVADGVSLVGPPCRDLVAR